MNIVYIVAIIIQAAIVVFFVRRGILQKKKRKSIQQAAPPASYEAHRNTAIGITAEQLKLTIPTGEQFVYGVVMDWNMGNMTTTLATYITGAANLYFSIGGGITGAGAEVAIAEAASGFVLAAQAYIARSVPVSTTELPQANCVRFYFLSNMGIYAAQEHMQFIQQNNSQWLSLFEKGNDVVSAMQGNRN